MDIPVIVVVETEPTEGELRTEPGDVMEVKENNTEMEESTEKILKVKMFRTFSAVYDGKNILDGAGRDSQYIYLLQLLWHRREEGVSRSLLMEAAFGMREPENPSHALRNALYRTKARLRNLGLPPINYIRKENECYYWNEKIPVETDAGRFEGLYQKAFLETEENRRLSLLQEACRIYQGEFLSEYVSCLWVTYEARKYREQFRRCVEEAAEIARKNKDYQLMKILGDHASMADPCADWEVLSMEALCAMRKTQEACDLYAKTTDFYLRECGNLPSQRLKAYLHRLDDNKEYSQQLLDNIQESMEEKSVEGGYVCSALVFQSMYQVFQRLTERGGESCCLMLCTVMDGEGRPARGDEMSETSEKLVGIIQRALRHCDIVARYGNNQYLALLVNISLEDCKVVQQRIDQCLKEEGLPYAMEYYANNLVHQ